MATSQKDSVRRYFVEHGTITTTEAYELFGCTSLRARISDFRNEGMLISKKMQNFTNRYGRKGQRAIYKYEGKSDES